MIRGKHNTTLNKRGVPQKIIYKCTFVYKKNREPPNS